MGVSIKSSQVTCSSCSNKFHASCANVTSTELKYFMETGSKWNCSTCIASLRTRRSSASDALLDNTSLGCSSADSNAPLTTEHFNTIMNELRIFGSIRDEVTEIRNLQNDLSLKISEIISGQSELKRCVEDCKAKITSHSSLLGQHETKINCLEQTVSELISGRDSLQAKVVKIETSMPEFNCPISNSAVAAELVAAESTERFRRSHNLIVRFLPEADADNSTNDIETIKEVLEHVVGGSSENIVSISRLGKTSNPKPRPIRIIFKNTLTPISLLRNGTRLRCTRFSRIKLEDDKTPSQVKYLQSLRDELKTRLDAGEKNITIKYTRGIPAIVNVPAKN